MRNSVGISPQQPEQITGAPDHALWTVTHPDEIVDHPSMSDAEKRAALASWASDMHAVEGVPALRRLESGAIVQVDEILSALRRLDATTAGEALAGRKPHTAQPRRGTLLASRRRGYFVRSRRRDDDDDPPPSAAALVVPRPPMLMAVSR